MRWLGLDELPQLVNVLWGDMSLIGPRPDQDFQFQYYAPSDRRKLAMRPGITSWAQVHGRNAVPWRDRIDLEIEYVQNFSLWLDVKIVLLTFMVIARALGVNSPATGTARDAPTDQAIQEVRTRSFR